MTASTTQRRASRVARASLTTAAVATALLVLAPSAAAAPFPATPFTISPVSVANTCATLESGKSFAALPCNGAPTQHFTYESTSKHLVNGNGQCAQATGAYGNLFTAAPCTAKSVILLDENPAGTADREHITYATGPTTNHLCFILISQNQIGGTNCGPDPKRDFAVKPAS